MNDILGVDDILGMVESGDLSGEEAAAILGVDDEVILGADETLGADDTLGMSDILGAKLRAQSKAAKQLLRKGVAARKLASSQVLTPKAPTSSGVQAIGFEKSVASLTSETVATQPQVWFKPMRLVVPGSIAAFFLIEDIIVGNVSQFPSSTPLAAETFIPEAEAVVMDLATVNPALNLSLRVRNIGGVTLTFRATFVGKQVQP